MPKKNAPANTVPMKTPGERQRHWVEEGTDRLTIAPENGIVDGLERLSGEELTRDTGNIRSWW